MLDVGFVLVGGCAMFIWTPKRFEACWSEAEADGKAFHM